MLGVIWRPRGPCKLRGLFQTGVQSQDPSTNPSARSSSAHARLRWGDAGRADEGRITAPLLHSTTRDLSTSRRQPLSLQSAICDGLLINLRCCWATRGFQRAAGILPLTQPPSEPHTDTSHLSAPLRERDRHFTPCARGCHHHHHSFCHSLTIDIGQFAGCSACCDTLDSGGDLARI